MHTNHEEDAYNRRAQDAIARLRRRYNRRVRLALHIALAALAAIFVSTSPDFMYGNWPQWVTLLGVITIALHSFWLWQQELLDQAVSYIEGTAPLEREPALKRPNRWWWFVLHASIALPLIVFYADYGQWDGLLFLLCTAVGAGLYLHGGWLLLDDFRQRAAARRQAEVRLHEKPKRESSPETRRTPYAEPQAMRLTGDGELISFEDEVYLAQEERRQR